MVGIYLSDIFGDATTILVRSSGFSAQRALQFRVSLNNVKPRMNYPKFSRLRNHRQTDWENRRVEADT